MVQLQLIIEGVALIATIRTFMIERRQDLETLSPTHLSAPVFDKRQHNLMSITGQGFAPIRRIVAIIVELIGPSQQRHCKLRRLVDVLAIDRDVESTYLAGTIAHSRAYVVLQQLETSCC